MSNTLKYLVKAAVTVTVSLSKGSKFERTCSNWSKQSPGMKEEAGAMQRIKVIWKVRCAYKWWKEAVPWADLALKSRKMKRWKARRHQ